MSSSSARIRGEDRFYSPPAVRRHQQEQQLLKQQRELKESVLSSSSSSSSVWKTTSSSGNKSVVVGVGVSRTNLDMFLESTMPVVQVQCLPKMLSGGLRNGNAGSRLYYNLSDLWESFSEWSAYGAGVPIVLQGEDSVVQYYVPQLSGIQIYVNPLKPSSSFRRLGEESDADSSDDSSECDPRKPSKSMMSSSSDDGERCNPPNPPDFQYVATESPYHREPLAEKVSILSSQYPGLQTYKSCDLLPESWMAVAWYPIYRIPTGPTLADLHSCFLTFHHLATPLITGAGDSFREAHARSPDVSTKLPLPAFGMASHKFQGSVWDGVREAKHTSSLLQAADEWLQRLKVYHPDYNFFTSPISFKR